LHGTHQAAFAGKPIPTGIRLKELQACISRAMEASSKVELATVE